MKVPGVAEVRVKGGTGRLFKEALLASRVEGGQSRPVAASRGQSLPLAASDAKPTGFLAFQTGTGVLFLRRGNCV